MKRLIVLICIALFSINVTAQIKDSLSVHIPTRVAKKIAVELVSCDSIKAVLDNTELQLMALTQRSKLQDTIIALNQEAIQNLNSQVEAQAQSAVSYQNLYKDCQKQYDGLYKRYKVAKRINKISKFSIITAAILGAVAYLFITK